MIVNECQLCPRAKSTAPARWETRKQIVNGEGVDKPSYMIILDAPTSEDDKVGEMCSGGVGSQLYECLRLARINVNDCYIVGANRCYASWATRRKEQEACRPWLLQDIEDHQPTVILAMGNGALWSTLSLEGITKQRGSVFEGPFGIPVIPTLSPASIFHSAGNREYILADLAKARRVLEGEETAELGEYLFASTVEEARQIRDYLLEFDEYAFDFETTGFNYLGVNDHILCASFCSVIGEAYVIPLVGQWSTDIWTPSEKKEIEDIIREILTSPANKIAANGKFDCQWAWHTLGCEVKNFDDDAQLAFANIHEERPHSLEYQRTIWTNMPRYEAWKDDPEIKEAIKQHGYHSIPTELLWPYAACDADCTFRVFHRVIKELIEESLETNEGKFMYPPKALKRVWASE